jgi:hypothetical protein
MDPLINRKNHNEKPPTMRIIRFTLRARFQFLAASGESGSAKRFPGNERRAKA